MTKAQALYSFWSSFGLPAYWEQSIPDDATMPYITYEESEASFEHEMPLTASLWYKDNSWVTIGNKADEIARRLFEMRGIAQKIEGGRFRVWEGETTTFQRMPDDTDLKVKRIVINVMVEFMTNY